MRVSFCTLTVMLASSAVFAGCSSSGFEVADISTSIVDKQGYEQYGAGCFAGVEAALTQASFINNAPECAPISVENGVKTLSVKQRNKALRGRSSSHYEANDGGTVLAANAPYGDALDTKLHSKTTRSKHESGFYIGLGGIAYNVGDDIYGAQVRAGYSLNKNIGIETEASLSVNKLRTEFVTGTSVGTTDESIKHAVGAYGVLRLPIADSFSLFARGGYHATKIEATEVVTAAGITTTTIDTRKVDGLALGGGIEMAISGRDSLRLEYTRYQSSLGFGSDALDSASISIAHKF